MRAVYLYVFFWPGVEHRGNVASVMDGDEESSVNESSDDTSSSICFPTNTDADAHAYQKRHKNEPKTSMRTREKTFKPMHTVGLKSNPFILIKANI